MKKYAMIAALIISGTAFAKNPWTQCGIGAMIFDDTPVAAAISNVIWDLGTTAVSSATMSEGSCSGKETAAAIFIQETYGSLEVETAMGNGENLAALMDIMNVQDSQKSEVIASMRTQMGQWISSEKYGQMDQTTKAQTFYSIMITAVGENG